MQISEAASFAHRIFLLYLLAANAITFLLYGLDKWKARKDRWRVPERVLLFAALLGGSAGALLGMIVFRHKIRKVYFLLGVPLIMIVQIGVWYLLVVRG